MKKMSASKTRRLWEIMRDIEDVERRGQLAVGQRRKLTTREYRLRVARLSLERYISRLSSAANVLEHSHAETCQTKFSGSTRRRLEHELRQSAIRIRDMQGSSGNMEHSHQRNLERICARHGETVTELESLEREITFLINEKTRLERERHLACCGL